MRRSRKKAYKLKPHVGAHWYPEPGAGMKRYEAGDTIMMFPEHAAKIANKLENYQPEEFQEPEPTVTLRIVERADLQYDVINEKTRQPVNDHALTLKQARVLAGENAFLEKMEEADEGEEETAPKPKLSKKHRGGGRYLVIDEGTGEAISDNFFSREDADNLIYGRVTLDELREAAKK